MAKIMGFLHLTTVRPTAQTPNFLAKSLASNIGRVLIEDLESISPGIAYENSLQISQV